MMVPEQRQQANLENVRNELAGRTALVLAGSGLALMWAILPWEPFSLLACIALGLLAALGGAVYALVRRGFEPARHLLVWGLLAWLLAAMALFDAPWLPSLGLLLSFVSAMLVSGGELPTALAIGAWALWLVRSGTRAYPLPPLLAAQALGAVLAWLAVRTLYTALEWAWTMQQRADHLLEISRDRQGELNKALKSLDLSNSLLRHTQHELITARQQAEEARMLKERFAANVSHELRTPLSIILGFSEMIYLSPEMYGEMRWPPKLRRAVYQIYRNSHHLLEMINDVLDLARFEMAGFTLDKEETSLEALVREAAEIASDLFQGRPVQLQVEIAPGLPTLRLDRTRMRQVLLNLLNNAARFTEQGQVRLEVKRLADDILISVSDTGAGIPGDRLGRIFEEFYQVDGSLRRRQGGFGLGLSICKRFIEAHHGRIWVESKVGSGSTFYFTLPILDHRGLMPYSQAGRPLQSSPGEARPAILLLDPDPAVAALVRRHIEEYDIIQADDVRSLDEQVVLHHPRAVICNMAPGQRASVQEELAHRVPVIECSLPSQAWLAGELGVAACLTKPLHIAQLLQEISRLEQLNINPHTLLPYASSGDKGCADLCSIALEQNQAPSSALTRPFGKPGDDSEPKGSPDFARGAVRDVLIVDDDRGFCQLVEQALEGCGRALVARHAYDGADGLRAMMARKPDLVLLDLIMPVMDGFQMLEEMRRRPEFAAVPVMLLTANSYIDDALAQRGSRLVVQRAGGLSIVDTLRCLKAVIGVLEPRHDGRAS